MPASHQKLPFTILTLRSIILLMASLFQKIKTLFKATLHELADKAIERSDLSIYDEYIRQAQRELETFRQTITPIFAQVRSTKRRREKLATRAAELDATIDAFLMKGKRTQAMVTQRQLISTLDLIEIYDGSLERQVTAAERLQEVLVRLEGRLDIAKQEREELAFLLQLAKAKEISTKSMKSLDSLMGVGDTDVAQAAENIRRRLDHADAAWEIQANSLDNQLDDAMHSLAVEGELAARMERLGIN